MSKTFQRLSGVFSRKAPIKRTPSIQEVIEAADNSVNSIFSNRASQDIYGDDQSFSSGYRSDSISDASLRSMMSQSSLNSFSFANASRYNSPNPFSTTRIEEEDIFGRFDEPAKPAQQESYYHGAGDEILISSQGQEFYAPFENPDKESDGIYAEIKGLDDESETDIAPRNDVPARQRPPALYERVGGAQSNYEEPSLNTTYGRLPNSRQLPSHYMREDLPEHYLKEDQPGYEYDDNNSTSATHYETIKINNFADLEGASNTDDLEFDDSEFLPRTINSSKNNSLKLRQAIDDADARIEKLKALMQKREEDSKLSSVNHDYEYQYLIPKTPTNKNIITTNLDDPDAVKITNLDEKINKSGGKINITNDNGSSDKETWAEWALAQKSKGNNGRGSK